MLIDAIIISCIYHEWWYQSSSGILLYFCFHASMLYLHQFTSEMIWFSLHNILTIKKSIDFWYFYMTHYFVMTCDDHKRHKATVWRKTKESECRVVTVGSQVLGSLYSELRWGLNVNIGGREAANITCWKNIFYYTHYNKNVFIGLLPS